MPQSLYSIEIQREKDGLRELNISVLPKNLKKEILAHLMRLFYFCTKDKCK